MISAGHIIPASNALLDRYAPEPFCVGDNALMSGATAGLLIGSVALVATAIALTILFPPAGAAAVVFMGLLYALGVTAGGAGLILGGYLIHQYIGHQERCEQAHSRLIGRVQRAEIVAESLLTEYGKALITSGELLIDAQFETCRSEPPLMEAIKSFRATLSTDFSPESLSLNIDRTEFVAHYLASFFGSRGAAILCENESEFPLVPLFPASITVKVCRKLELLAMAARRWEASKLGAQIFKGSSHHFSIELQEGDEFAKDKLISNLRGYFSTQPLCVKEYLILHCIYLQRNIGLSTDNKKHLMESFAASFYFLVAHEFGRGDKDHTLAEFIVTHAQELFPEEYAAYSEKIDK